MKIIKFVIFCFGRQACTHHIVTNKQDLFLFLKLNRLLKNLKNCLIQKIFREEYIKKQLVMFCFLSFNLIISFFLPTYALTCIHYFEYSKARSTWSLFYVLFKCSSLAAISCIATVFEYMEWAYFKLLQDCINACSWTELYVELTMLNHIASF